MREDLFTVVCLSFTGITQIALSFQSKSRWMQAFSIIGSLLVVVGVARTDYYHDVHAKYFLSIPGAVLVGISTFLQAAHIVRKIRPEQRLKGEA